MITVKIFVKTLMAIAFIISVAGFWVENKIGQWFSYTMTLAFCLIAGYLYLWRGRRNSLLIFFMFFYLISLRTGFSIYTRLDNPHSDNYYAMLFLLIALLVYIPINIIVIKSNWKPLKNWIRYFFWN